MPRCLRRSAAAATLLLLAAAGGEAQPRTRADCEAAHPAKWGQAGKDVVWVPTFDAVILAMLSMTQVTSSDVVLDLGAGDGRIAIAAAKPPFGATARGIEYDPEMAKLASCIVGVEGLNDKVRIVQGDIFKEDFRGASVVTMYLLTHLNLCVRHRLLAMPPGTRVASHHYEMGDWKPDQSVDVNGRGVHAWIVPARVDGVWAFRDSQGATFSADLRQSFAALSGEVTRNGLLEPLESATLRGSELRFTFGPERAPIKFSGTVRGSEITGVLSAGTSTSTAARTVVGRLQGALRAAPWADMPPDCRQFYDR
jgi:hypothetical protein